MTFTRTKDVDGASASPAGLIDLLPRGWHHLPIPDVDRTVVIGPAGLYVLVTRSATVVPIDRIRAQPWNGFDRRRPANAQVTSDLVSQLVSSLCDLELTCRPVVVLADDDNRLVARVDDVPVFHRRRLAEWLARQPARLDPFTTTRVVETVTGVRPSLAC